MSYNLELLVKIDGTDLFARVAKPEYSNPTYNLRQMFVQAMDWDYKQCDKYKCEEVIENIEMGIRELKFYPRIYKKYEPENKWGTVESAIRDLESLRDCIYETGEYIPIEHLWMRW